MQRMHDNTLYYCFQIKVNETLPAAIFVSYASLRVMGKLLQERSISSKSKFFLLRVISFCKTLVVQGSKQKVTKFVYFCRNEIKKMQVYFIPRSEFNAYLKQLKSYCLQ